MEEPDGRSMDFGFGSAAGTGAGAGAGAGVGQYMICVDCRGVARSRYRARSVGDYRGGGHGDSNSVC